MKKLLTFLAIILISYLSFSQCEVTKEVDKFTNEITFRSETVEGIRFIKKNYYYISIRYISMSNNPMVGYRNGMLLLEDNTKIDLIGEVKINVNNYGQFEYSIFSSISIEDLNRIANSPITDYRLIFDRSINEGEKISCLAKAILNSNLNEQ